MILKVSLLMIGLISLAKTTASKRNQNYDKAVDFFSAHFKDILNVPTNVSQTEYYSKHTMFFKKQRQANIRRLLDAGEKARGVTRKLINEFTPIDVQSLDDNTDEFTYNLKLPKNTRHVESAELRFMIIPGSCSKNSRQVTFSLMDQEEVTFDVNDCEPRWDSIRTQKLKIKSRTAFKVRCIDCADQDVTYSAPYLNIITTSKPTATDMMKRAPPKRKPKRPTYECRRDPLNFHFSDFRSYSLITTPSEFDIGICAGRCKPPYQAYNTHTILHYSLYRKGFTNKLPCCVPRFLNDIVYMYKNGTELVEGVFGEGLAESCGCR